MRHRIDHLFGYVDAVHHLAFLAGEDAAGPGGDDHVAVLLQGVADDTDDSRRSGEDHRAAYLHAAADLVDLAAADSGDDDAWLALSRHIRSVAERL